MTRSIFFLSVMTYFDQLYAKNARRFLIHIMFYFNNVANYFLFYFMGFHGEIGMRTISIMEFVFYSST